VLVPRVRVFALVLALAGSPALANGITVAKHDAAPPDAIAAPVKALLAPGGVTATVGDVAIQIWWAKSVEAKGAGWSGVPEGALVGAMNLPARFKDIRGRNIPPGVYLLRFGLQPQNGDHLGVSPHREFLLATPAAEDTSPAALGHDPTVELAAKTINISHPAVFSIDPPAAQEAAGTVVQTPDGFTSLVLEVPSSQGALRFGLVLIGHIEA
jgi:hypothetical protein